jgi:hypothetical protein
MFERRGKAEQQQQGKVFTTLASIASVNVSVI